MSFLDFGFIDLIDIVLVAYLFYKLYMLIKGTIAINIFTVIAIIYLIWTFVKAINMQLLSTILGQFIGVGVLAIIIVFQQEIRRFFLLIYSEYLANFNLSIENIFARFIKTPPQVKIYSIVKYYTNLFSVSCKTVGDSGVPCLFPFIYRNTTYYQCTTKYVLFLLNQNYIFV